MGIGCIDYVAVNTKFRPQSFSTNNHDKGLSSSLTASSHSHRGSIMALEGEVFRLFSESAANHLDPKLSTRSGPKMDCFLV